MSTKPLTERQAMAAYRAVCKRFKVDPHDETVEQGGARWPSGQPVLCRNFEGWYSTTPWAVVWEEGPFEWTMHVEQHDVPAGVFAEPVNGYSLGLYRD